MLDLTIIIANYNTRDLLESCLESVYRYTEGISFEVICVDDASPDGSADMVTEQFPQVILIRNSERRLYARNHNAGMRIALGRYACHLDSDTLLTRNALAAMVRFMDEHPDIAACGPKLLKPDGSVQHCTRGFASAGTFILEALNWHKLVPNSRVHNRYYNVGFDYSRVQRVESISTCAYVARRSTWERAGLFDERFGQFMVDHAYNYVLKRMDLPVYYMPWAEVIHFGSQSIGQDPRGTLRDEAEAFIQFNDAYDYFGSNPLLKLVVRLAVRARYLARLLEYSLRADKRIVKGPPPLPAPAVAESWATRSTNET